MIRPWHLSAASASPSALSASLSPLYNHVREAFVLLFWESSLWFCFLNLRISYYGGSWWNVELAGRWGARNLLPVAACVWLDMWPGCSLLPLPAQNFLSRMDRPEACAVGRPVIGVVSGPQEMLLNEVATLPSSWFPRPPLIFAYFSRLSLASCSW